MHLQKMSRESWKSFKIGFGIDNTEIYSDTNSMTKKTKIILIVAPLLLLIIAGSVCTGLIINKKNKDKTVNIAFYGISESLCKTLQNKFPSDSEIKINFVKLPDGAVDSDMVAKKYDLLFAWKGEVTSSLENVAKDIPEDALLSIPSSMRSKKCLPLLLDNYEIDFYKPVKTKIEVKPESSYAAFEQYLKLSKDKVFTPFFATGGDDSILLNLSGTIVESFGGVEAYTKLITEVANAKNLEEFWEVPLSSSDKNLTYKSVLDLFKAYSAKEYMHPLWFNGNENDLIFFAEQNQIGVFYTTLSQHRRFKYNVIRDFESTKFPAASGEEHGLIAPAVSVVLLSNNSNAKDYVMHLISSDVQEALSNETMLAPVEYRAEAYDRQADDVRFWAASCHGGAMPDLVNATMQTDSEKLKLLAKGIRTYLLH